MISQKTRKPATILAIESSCDETAAAVLTASFPAGKFPVVVTRSSVIRSQIKLHSAMGGVVPETAARAHVKNILPVIKKALRDSKLKLKDMDCIAVTAGPGLTPSLIVGVEFAKALSLGTGIPILPINHMAGHLYSPLASLAGNKQDIFPQIALIVSGGHTLLVLLENPRRYRVLGQTQDDAAGEAFDKVAKLLGLPYPGGPEVSKRAAGATKPVTFPRPMIHSADYSFSFSGLKTAVLYYIQRQPSPLPLSAVKDICAGFEQAAVEVLCAKTMKAVREFKGRSVSISGGVSANQSLRETMKKLCQKAGITLFVPPPKLSTDNAEMIGIAAGYELWKGKRPGPPAHILADSNLQL